MTSLSEEASDLVDEWDKATALLKVERFKAIGPDDRGPIADLQAFYFATREKVFADAFQRIQELGLDVTDYRQKLNEISRNRALSFSEVKIVAMISKEIEEGCGKELAYHRTAARIPIYSETFDGAVKLAQRTYLRAVKIAANNDDGE